MVDHETCGIMIEPVQGEGGVRIPPDGFLQGLRRIADDNGCLLIFDEVQTGMARTGSWLAYQQFDVKPDVMTMAKGIAAGVACGALITTSELAPDLRPGMHASTFGGNPLAMAAGIATVQTIEEDGLLDNVAQRAAEFRQHFEQLKAELPIIGEVRVMGMMVGVDLTIPSGPAVGKCMERGLLINATQDTVVRLLPPLNVTPEQVEEGCSILSDVLKEMAAEAV
jgi:acetylornithine/succinyldiaminopimelate/putrescine aminotransferase